MRNGRIMVTVAAAVLCLAGLAGAATTIEFLDTYDHDNDTNTAMIVKPAATYLYFDPNNWTGGAIPQFEGETASVNDWYSYTYDPNWVRTASTQFRVLDMAGGVVDLVGRGYDPGNFLLRRCYGAGGLGGITLADSSVGKTSYVKANVFQVGSFGDYNIEVPIIVNQFIADYRGADVTINASVDANMFTVGQGRVTINNPTAISIKTVDIKFDNGIPDFIVPMVAINAPVTGLTTIAMAQQMWGEYDANGDGALGTAVNVTTGSVVVRQAQTTFPTITLGANCTLAGNLAGATYGAGGKVQFQPGSILGDTVGSNDPNRTLAGGATLYKPVAGISSGTILSGDDGVGAYKGVGIGSWSDSNSLGATIQARASSGDLNIGIAVADIYMDADTTLIGDGASTTANIKVFPGNGQITLANGGINQTAIGASTPNLITTFNIDGVEGDKSPANDAVGSDEKWTIFETSGTGAILPGQTVKITNGVYQMDTYNAVNTVGGKLIIGGGGALEIRDSNSIENFDGLGNYNRPANPVQFSATGSLEVQNRGLLKLPDGNSLGAVGSDAGRVTVSGTPMVLFNRADDGYDAAWNAEVTIDAAANPGLQKILDEADIILHNCYRVSDAKRMTKFMGDGLRIRDGGLVTTGWAVDTGNRPQTGVRADSTYFGPAANGGSFTIATPSGSGGIWIYCPIGDGSRKASTIYINSQNEIETTINTGWYPYTINLGRAVGVPTGNVNLYGTIYADELVVRNGSCVLDGATVANAGVHVIAENGKATIQNGGASSWVNGKITVGVDGYVDVASSTTGLGDVTVNSLFVNNVSGLKVNSTSTVVSGRLSGTGSWGQAAYIRVGASGTVAPGGDSGNSVGSINDTTGNGLWFESGATIEWQIADKTDGPGIGWDVIYATQFDFAVTSEAESTLNFNILDAGLAEDIEASDRFEVCKIRGTGSTFDLPTSTWTVIFDAPEGWDTSAATLEYVSAEKTLYLTGLVSKLVLPGDTNDDKVVDAADFMTLKKNFGAGIGGDYTVGNFDETGTVDWADLNILTANMGATSPAPSTAPEPATLGLLALGAMAVLRRRSRRA